MAKPRGITRKVSPYEWQVFTRLEWAESELQRLDDAAQAFLNAQTVTTSAWSNPDGTEYIIRVDQGIKKTPIELALMIGDVAHHARSALDWLAWGLAIQPNNTTAFPIWTRPPVKNGQPVHPSIAGGVGGHRPGRRGSLRWQCVSCDTCVKQGARGSGCERLPGRLRCDEDRQGNG
jgi:hypothetical protein